MKTKNLSFNIHFHKNVHETKVSCTGSCKSQRDFHVDEKDLETGGIWDDAGFRPPKLYMQYIEFLHIMLLNEEYIPEYCLKEIIEIINSPYNKNLFIIDDRNRMYRFAESLGIDVLNSDDGLIAAGITCRIISDYIQPDGVSPVTEKKSFSNK